MVVLTHGMCCQCAAGGRERQHREVGPPLEAVSGRQIASQTAWQAGLADAVKRAENVSHARAHAQPCKAGFASLAVVADTADCRSCLFALIEPACAQQPDASGSRRSAAKQACFARRSPFSQHRGRGRGRKCGWFRGRGVCPAGCPCRPQLKNRKRGVAQVPQRCSSNAKCRAMSGTACRLGTQRHGQACRWHLQPCAARPI
jgi:hypothetical protein